MLRRWRPRFHTETRLALHGASVRPRRVKILLLGIYITERKEASLLTAEVRQKAYTRPAAACPTGTLAQRQGVPSGTTNRPCVQINRFYPNDQKSHPNHFWNYLSLYMDKQPKPERLLFFSPSKKCYFSNKNNIYIYFLIKIMSWNVEDRKSC